MYKNGILPSDDNAVIDALGDINVALRYIDGTQRVLLNGEDVSGDIRLPEISMYASAVSAIPKVREFLLELQRKSAQSGSVVMDGRDIGTVIMPDADVKLFLTASPEARAKRRYDELVAQRKNVTLEEVANDMEKRDRDDSTRAAAPAVKADDAVIIDNSYMQSEDSLAAALAIIDSKLCE